jgi:hypothetical protein
MIVPNTQRLSVIIHILEVNSERAFVWIRRHLSENYNILNEYNMFPTPHTETCFRTILGNGYYSITTENPKNYRNRNIYLMDNYNEHLFESVRRIYDGTYKYF